jgi:hypothetical protein
VTPSIGAKIKIGVFNFCQKFIREFYLKLCYTAPVQTPFYVSGFLYNHKSQQILLIQPDSDTDAPSLWSTIGGEGKTGEDPQATFQRVVNQFLGITLKPKDIYPIYDYTHDDNKLNYVFYAEVGSNKSSKNVEGNLSWFTFTETLKLKFTPHTKQDLMVGERVINAKWRDDEAKREQLLIL